MDTLKTRKPRVHITRGDLEFHGVRTVEEFAGEPPEWAEEAIQHARACAAQNARRRANGDSAEGSVRK